MANPNQLVNDLRGLAVELGDVLDRIEAKLVMSGSLGGDTPGAADGTGAGWLQALPSTGTITGDDSEGLTKGQFLNLLGTFGALQGLLGQGHRTNINRWRW